jgi:lipoprotein signal peptidase
MLPNPKHIRVWPCWLSVIGLISLDWISKTFVRATLSPQMSYPIWGDFLKINYVQNYRGVSWWVPSLPNWSRFILSALFVVVIFAAYPIYLFYVNQHRHTVWVDIAFVGILASCSGHLLDDVLLAYTVDFIQVFGSPSANLADIFSYTGIFALVLETILVHRGRKHTSKGLHAWVEREKALRDEFMAYYRERK